MSQSKHVLLVDDDPVFLAVAEAMVSALGPHRIATASDGQAGLAALRAAESPIDLIVLDLNMPRLDGLAFMRGLRNEGFCGDVVVSSGEGDAILKSAQRMGELLGVRIVGALKKPLTPESLAPLLAMDASHAPAPPDSPMPSLYGVADLKLIPFYQPQYEVETRAIPGLEALIRVETADGQIHGPGHLFGHVHDQEELTSVSLSIAGKVLDDLARWRRRDLGCRVSINMDASVLEAEDVAPQLIEMVLKRSIAPDTVCLELTETALPKDLSRIIEVLTRLRMAGFELSLDDYGTGSSNYELLRLCPFTELKIDASIVQSASREPMSKRFLEVATAMARDLDMRVIAEGVETAAQLEFVWKAGIRLVQGFLFSRALPADEVCDLLLVKAARASG